MIILLKKEFFVHNLDILVCINYIKNKVFLRRYLSNVINDEKKVLHNDVEYANINTVLIDET